MVLRLCEILPPLSMTLVSAATGYAHDLIVGAIRRDSGRTAAFGCTVARHPSARRKCR